jgi:predicted dehydrogenase
LTPSGDLAAAFIRFDNGASLEIEASWAANIREDELMETRLYGTKGGLVQRNLDESYQFEAELFLERGGAHYDARLHHAEAMEASAMSHFVDCIVGDRPHMATGEEGLRVMEILDAIYQSAEQGQPVAIGG